MEKIKMDLSNRAIAEASRNKTAMIGVLVMNLVLCAAYFVEVIKGARTLGAYLVLAVICVLSSVLSFLVYLRKKDAVLIRYICGFGFLLFYTIVMLTATTELTFCYVLVVFSIFLVYEDLKFSFIVGAYAFLVNLASIIKVAVTVGLSAQDITNAEIKLACLFMVILFAMLAIKKITQIGRVNIEKADMEKEQSEKLLQTTLAVADSITRNIDEAVSETESLNTAIDATQRSMEELTSGTNDTIIAIEEQQKNTAEIDGYIKDVEASTSQIVEELANTEENLNAGHEIMNELLAQVKVSENSSTVVAKEMEGLKENADQMQNIVGMISSVAHQTSLLSLNASIEAARAGEAGKGFAVVAGEISNLANQTNNATGDINKLIENITLSIAEVTAAMNELLESNRFQNDYVARTAENFDKIHSSANVISKQADELRQAVCSVTVSNAHVVESIDNVSAVTEEVTASANETLASCNRNLESIEKVMQIMEKLGEDAKKLQQ